MFDKLFKRNKETNETTLVAPLDGELILLEEVPDPVFSQKMMGNGVAIKPSNETVTSPVEGEIVQVFPTKHAIGIKTEDDIEILVHIGLETVNLNGEGFTLHITEGDKVKPGDKLVTFDENIIQDKAKSTITPIIITNTNEMSEIKIADQKTVTAAQDEIIYVKK